MKKRACPQCGEPVAQTGKRGRPAVYCSAFCKGRASHLRAVADGRYAERIARKAAERAANRKLCPYCGEPLPGWRRVQCGSPDCERRYHSDRGRASRTGRECESCGRVFRDHGRRCYFCRFPAHECVKCGNIFRGQASRCSACRQVERQCRDCGGAFIVAAKDRNFRCEPCRSAERRCRDCDRVVRGPRTWRCGACRAKERICEGCGKAFKGNGRRCPPCYRLDRVCTDCGRSFRGDRPVCWTCLRAAMPADELAARRRSDSNKRRAKQARSQFCGPVPAVVYARVLASGPCVYCYDVADTVDHVRPLADGGPEAESNLVPACGRCNYGKGAKLLTEWDPLRVLLALEVSPVVAAEWARLTALTAA